MRLQIGDYEFIYIQETYDKFFSLCESILRDTNNVLRLESSASKIFASRLFLW